MIGDLLFYQLIKQVLLFQRLFHCVCERDEMGWPKLTTLALDIELRAYCVPENTRNRIIKELDPENRGEVRMFHSYT